MTDTDASVVYAAPERRSRYIELGFWRQGPSDPGTLIHGCVEDGALIFDIGIHTTWHEEHEEAFVLPESERFPLADLYRTSSGEVLTVPLHPAEPSADFE